MLFGRYINRKLRTAHPNIYTWALAMSDLLDRSALEITSLRSGRPVRRDIKNVFAEKNHKLHVLQRKVQEGEKDPVVFLTEASSLCKGYHLWLARNLQSYDRDVLLPEGLSTQSQSAPEEDAQEDARVENVFKTSCV